MEKALASRSVSGLDRTQRMADQVPVNIVPTEHQAPRTPEHQVPQSILLSDASRPAAGSGSPPGSDDDGSLAKTTPPFSASSLVKSQEVPLSMVDTLLVPSIVMTMAGQAFPQFSMDMQLDIKRRGKSDKNQGN